MLLHSKRHVWTTYLLVLNHGSNLSLFGLVESREIHCIVLGYFKNDKGDQKKKKEERVNWLF